MNDFDDEENSGSGGGCSAAAVMAKAVNQQLNENNKADEDGEKVDDNFGDDLVGMCDQEEFEKQVLEEIDASVTRKTIEHLEKKAQKSEKKRDKYVARIESIKRQHEEQSRGGAVESNAFDEFLQSFSRPTKIRKIEKKKEDEDAPKEEVKPPVVVVEAEADDDLHELNEEEEDRSAESVEYIHDRYRCNSQLWTKLFPYQREAVIWLLNLHDSNIGAILADEMGLGKTLQVIALLAALRASRLPDCGFRGLGPVLIVCPATVLQQWRSEFKTFAPFFKIGVLHSSAGSRTLKQLRHSDIILTTYGTFLTSSSESLLRCGDILWHYFILDEGHRIRNPLAKITKAVKAISTPHRIILSGTPIQNSLRELWSLFDFIYPGKLGNLQHFLSNFSIPIVQGGYATASQLQVQTAYKCACVLRDTIAPFLLRRTKRSLLTLPTKTEQVLFCKISPEQEEMYVRFLESETVSKVLTGRISTPFQALIKLRQICNHPKILQPSSFSSDINYSGKMKICATLLRTWHNEKRKVLMFFQGVKALKIFQKYVDKKGYTYHRMDGSVAIKSREFIINDFNTNPDIFLFMLTTRTGGLGLNLTGADRVIIFDPDWNPATDLQARERTWRIGQNKNVAIYRLVASGTIEEKIYHRQVFKQHLTNRVLANPKQRKFFKVNELRDLFTYKSPKEKNEDLLPKYALGATAEQRKDKFMQLARELSKRIESGNAPSSINGVIRMEKLAMPKPEDEGGDFVIKKLLKKENVSEIKFETEDSVYNDEAERIAKKALQSLKNEAASSPSSSTDLLARIKARQSGGSVALPSSTKADLKRKLVDYLNLQTGHSARSAQLVQHFESLNEFDARIFKSILKRVALFDKRLAEWQLKPTLREYY